MARNQLCGRGVKAGTSHKQPKTRRYARQGKMLERIRRRPGYRLTAPFCRLAALYCRVYSLGGISSGALAHGKNNSSASSFLWFLPPLNVSILRYADRRYLEAPFARLDWWIHNRLGREYQRPYHVSREGFRALVFHKGAA
mgnify:CR=1 FL=1